MARGTDRQEHVISFSKPSERMAICIGEQPVSKKRPRGIRRPVENLAKLDESVLITGKVTGQRQNHPAQSSHKAAVSDFLPAETVEKLQVLAASRIVR